MIFLSKHYLGSWKQVPKQIARSNRCQVLDVSIFYMFIIICMLQFYISFSFSSWLILHKFLHLYNLHDPFRRLIYYFAHDEVSCRNFWEVPAPVQIREVALDLIKGPGKILKYSRLYAVLGWFLMGYMYTMSVSLVIGWQLITCELYIDGSQWWSMAVKTSCKSS